MAVRSRLAEGRGLQPGQLGAAGRREREQLVEQGAGIGAQGGVVVAGGTQHDLPAGPHRERRALAAWEFWSPPVMSLLRKALMALSVCALGSALYAQDMGDSNYATGMRTLLPVGFMTHGHDHGVATTNCASCNTGTCDQGCNYAKAGIFGDILCARMAKRGVTALITDGVMRDVAGVLGGTDMDSTLRSVELRPGLEQVEH